MFLTQWFPEVLGRDFVARPALFGGTWEDLIERRAGDT